MRKLDALAKKLAEAEKALGLIGYWEVWAKKVKFQDPDAKAEAREFGGKGGRYPTRLEGVRAFIYYHGDWWVVAQEGAAGIYYQGKRTGRAIMGKEGSVMLEGDMHPVFRKAWE